MRTSLDPDNLRDPVNRYDPDKQKKAAPFGAARAKRNANNRLNGTSDKHRISDATLIQVILDKIGATSLLS